MDVTETAPLLQDSDIRANGGKGFTRRRAVIVPVLVLYFCATGMNLYIVPEYTQSHITLKYTNRIDVDLKTENTSYTTANECKHESNSSDPHNTQIQQEAAKWSMYFSIASMAPAIIANFFYGTYSDVKGRKLMLSICILGMTLKVAIFTVVAFYNSELVYLIIGNVIEGCTGSFMAVFSVVFSFVADITDPGKGRTTFIVMFELLFGLTITVSAFFTGYFIEAFGYPYTILQSTIMCALSLVLCVALLPETRLHQDRTARRSVLATVANCWKFYINPESKLLRTKYILLILSFAFLAITRMNSASLETIYLMGFPFCWNPKKISWFMTSKLGAASLASIGGAYIFQKCLSEAAIGLIGAANGAVALVVEGLATSNAVMYTVPALSSLVYLGFPMIRSIMSHLTSQDKQGALFASISVVETMSALLGSLTSSIVYAATIEIMNGFVFLVLAFLSLISAVILIAYILVDKYCKLEVHLLREYPNNTGAETNDGVSDQHETLSDGYSM